MAIRFDDLFDVDLAATMTYSAQEAAEHCTCAFCRNFYAALDRYTPEVRPFLAWFGVDAEAPDHMIPELCDDGFVGYQPEYMVFGKMRGNTSIEIMVGNTRALFEKTGEGTDRFVITLLDLKFPWVMVEPMDETEFPFAGIPLVERSLEGYHSHPSDEKTS